MTSREGDPENSAVQLSGLGNNVNMAGISLAVFTFLLFFSSTQAHSPLFQVTLGLIIAAIFSFSVAGLYSFVLVYSAPAKHTRLQSHRNRAEWFFALGLAILLLEPSLILFTVGFQLVGSVALILFLAYMAIYVLESRTVHSIRDR